MQPFVEDTLIVVLAAVLGAVIGAEREWRRHPGGLRSCALIAGAACVFSHIAVSHSGANPGPMLGSIVQGVGFLGAGVILHKGTNVVGLSTAATFWAVAAVGIATGLTELGLAVALTALVLCGHAILRPVSAWIDRKAPAIDVRESESAV